MLQGRNAATPEQMLDYLQTNVRVDGDCLIWAGFYNGVVPAVNWKKRQHSVRRLLWTMTKGAKPSGTLFWARCGNPSCVAITHIRAGTRTEHTRWNAANGRLPTGLSRSIQVAKVRYHTARLGLKQRHEVASMRAQGMTYEQIGAHFGVHPTSVGHFIRNWTAKGIQL